MLPFLNKAKVGVDSFLEWKYKHLPITHSSSVPPLYWVNWAVFVVLGKLKEHADQFKIINKIWPTCKCVSHIEEKGRGVVGNLAGFCLIFSPYLPFPFCVKEKYVSVYHFPSSLDGLYLI